VQSLLAWLRSQRVAVHNGFDSPESDHRNDRQQPRQRRASAATAATDAKITNDDSKQENTMVVGRSALPPPESTNQTALITGGTAGIGLAVARLLVREGAAVIVSGRDRERGQKAVNDIGGNIRFVQADLADLNSVKSHVLQSGYVDIIVNNAASFPAALTTNEALGRALPLRRTAQASEIAQAVLFLASPRSSFVTGSTLHVDGGGTAV
jgi:NAD(P)-dependent dehydrogenase (short-subunit alcohol dehydrogenase family)